MKGFTKETKQDKLTKAFGRDNPLKWSENRTNQALIIGRAEEEFMLEQEGEDESFYKITVKVKRTSGTIDHIPVRVSDCVLKAHMLQINITGKFIEVKGQICSENFRSQDGKRHTKMYLLAETITLFEEEDEKAEAKYKNEVYILGQLSKEPQFRATPLGRKITDLVVTVSGSSGTKNHINCVVWGKQAEFVAGYLYGDYVKIYGRIQSREYLKRNTPDSNEGEIKSINEVSVTEIRREIR